MKKIFATAALGLETQAGDAREGFCSLGDQLHLNTLFGVQALRAAGASPIQVDDLIKASLYYLILHELGHTFGLNHNMKASQLHSPEVINNRYVTSKIGLAGSVMDYPAINLAPPGEKQGEYYTSKPGPYDKWAIEFGYAESLDDSGAERERQEKLLDRSTEPALE